VDAVYIYQENFVIVILIMVKKGNFVILKENQREENQRESLKKDVLKKITFYNKKYKKKL